VSGAGTVGRSMRVSSVIFFGSDSWRSAAFGCARCAGRASIPPQDP
jgi:hypothetical protein